MIINVLALGDSLKAYKVDENICIGVNDIFKYHYVDYLIILDSPKKFQKDRLEIIKSSNPKLLLSHNSEWSFMPMFKKIELASARGKLNELDTDKYCYSSISPFVAVIQAYKLGAKEIIIYGVDLTNHSFINTKDQIENIKKHFSQLNYELNKRKVKLVLGAKYGVLKNILPSIIS